MLSVRSKKEINQNINTNSKIYNIEGGKKSMKVNDKVVKRLKLKPTCDTPKFQDFKHSTLTQNHNIYGGKHQNNVTQTDNDDTNIKDEIHDAQAGLHATKIITNHANFDSDE